MSNLQYTAR